MEISGFLWSAGGGGEVEVGLEVEGEMPQNETADSFNIHDSSATFSAWSMTKI